MPTALELQRQEWQRYIDADRHQSPALTPEDRQAYEGLIRRIRDAVSAVKAQFNIRRIVLFGSLAHQAWYQPDVDVDLAVEGLVGRDYWKVWKLLEDMIGDRPVDLIEIETASTSLKQAIERYGIEL